MKKILVTTDFSSNSKAGLRFAIQLASLHPFELTFFHSFYIMKPTSINDKESKLYVKKETDKIQAQLENFVGEVYKIMKAKPGKFKCIINSSVLTDTNIRTYASKNKYNYICICTRGAGRFKKIFGTNTSNLIQNSSVPVITVPHNYRRNKITHIMYATDTLNLEKELKKVVDFSKPFMAKVELLHFNYPAELANKTQLIKQASSLFSKQQITMNLVEVNMAKNLVENIKAAVTKSKPSLLIMFTQQNKGFFDTLFFPSNSAEYSFDTKTPLLIYNKT